MSRPPNCVTGARDVAIYPLPPVGPGNDKLSHYQLSECSNEAVTFSDVVHVHGVTHSQTWSATPSPPGTASDA